MRHTTHHDEVTKKLYDEFSPERGSHFALVKIDPAPHTWHMISFFPTRLEDRIPNIMRELSRKHMLNIEGRVLHNLDEYCQVYHSSIKERDTFSKDFLDYVLRRNVFSANNKLYQDVELYERGNKVTVIDVVQGNVIAQVNVMGGNKQTLHRKLASKRQKLRAAYDFCQRHGYGEPKLVIINGRMDSDGWHLEPEIVHSLPYADDQSQVLNK